MKTFLKGTALLIAAIVIFLAGHFTTIHHSLTGTYSAGNEPDLRNVYVVLHADQSFMVYDQEAALASGQYEAVSQDEDVYALIDETGDKVGYVVQDGKRIVLLGINDTEQILEKISDDAMYLHDVES